MFALQLGTKFFLPRRFMSQAQIITLLAELPSTNNRDILRRKYFFFLLKSDRHKKGKKQTNKRKTRKKQNTTIKPTIKCRKVTLASAGLSY